MGLLKNFEQPTGVVVTYWEIIVMEITVNFRRTLISNIGDLHMMNPVPIGMDIDDKIMNVYLVGYLNKAAKDAGKVPIASETVMLQLPETVNTVDDLTPTIYELIKQTDAWSDAIDA